MKPGTTVAVVILFLIALAHLLRLVFQVEIIVGGVTLPMWASILGCVVPAFIAVMLLRESRRPPTAPPL